MEKRKLLEQLFIFTTGISLLLFERNLSCLDRFLMLSLSVASMERLFRMYKKFKEK